ncbi:hypothetical protein H8959_010131 [Pygathrix nigripes]
MLLLHFSEDNEPSQDHFCPGPPDLAPPATTHTEAAALTDLPRSLSQHTLCKPLPVQVISSSLTEKYQQPQKTMKRKKNYTLLMLKNAVSFREDGCQMNA